MIANEYHMGRKAGSSILHSVRSAEALGRPLNTFVTINFWQLGSTAETIFRDFADLREAWFQRWSSCRPRKSATPRNGVPTYAYVHEATHDLPHTHWMVHIQPENVALFTARLEQVLRKTFNLSALPDGAIFVTTIENAEGLKLYMVKTIDLRFGRLWGIRTENGGRIAFRRADTSRNIGPSFWQPQKARYRAYLRQVRVA
ncbi:hypothetical protein [Roseinatronobacter alkalisoli]|uniref:Replication endonuclease n=1 Tax=Roseinatronobacter alkalisoli TaxID=3028235 RepID=A0ABT5TFN8_9RHOB|nr:hypothetical protein [Roseinatronobacter sp. HJB301]MDD7973942.1 hypothetical protein [Roseinatronobacter sp. HJB301]